METEHDLSEIVKNAACDDQFGGLNFNEVNDIDRVVDAFNQELHRDNLEFQQHHARICSLSVLAPLIFKK